MTHSLGIDVGTTNVKVALVRDDGAVIARAARRLETTTSGDVSEQDPAALWDALCDAVRELTTTAPAAARDVVSIGTCSQYSSIVPVTADGDPVGPVVMWTDMRGTDASWAIAGRHANAFETWIEHHGIPPIGSGLSLAHMLYLQLERPEIHDATHAYVEVMDYVIARLTGTVSATQCTQFAVQLCDNRTVGTTTYDDELLALSGIDASKLPPLLAIDGAAGALRSDVAAAVGLPPGIAVRSGINDSHAGAYATGAWQPERAGVMVGTTAVLLDTFTHLAVDLEREILSMPAPHPGAYLVWGENGPAGRTVEHALHEWFRNDDDPFGGLDAALAASPAGANGAMFLPWLAGSMAPVASRSARGGYLNCSLDTSRADLVRATIEGTARNVRWLLEAVESFTATPIRDVTFAGGAARSQGWAQAFADVLHRPVLALDDPSHAVSRAVALAALISAEGGDPRTDARFAPTGTAYEPDPAAARVHDHAQAQFEAAFMATRPICEALARPPITEH